MIRQATGSFISLLSESQLTAGIVGKWRPCVVPMVFTCWPRSQNNFNPKQRMLKPQNVGFSFFPLTNWTLQILANKACTTLHAWLRQNTTVTTNYHSFVVSSCLPFWTKSHHLPGSQNWSQSLKLLVEMCAPFLQKIISNRPPNVCWKEKKSWGLFHYSPGCSFYC